MFEKFEKYAAFAWEPAARRMNVHQAERGSFFRAFRTAKSLYKTIKKFCERKISLHHAKREKHEKRQFVVGAIEKYTEIA